MTCCLHAARVQHWAAHESFAWRRSAELPRIQATAAEVRMPENLVLIGAAWIECYQAVLYSCSLLKSCGAKGLIIMRRHSLLAGM